MSRLNKDLYYLGIAEAVANRSTCIRRRYGAVIVKNDEIVSSGYNGAPRGEANCSDLHYCNREKLNVPKGERYELCVAVHAEQNAMISASRDRMIDSTIYIVGLEFDGNGYANSTPCLLCRKMLRNAGVSRVVGYIDGEVCDIDISLKEDH